MLTKAQERFQDESYDELMNLNMGSYGMNTRTLKPNNKKSYPQEEISALIGDFPNYFRRLSSFVYDWSLRKGFDREGVKRNDAEQIALMHSELSEALEYLRNGNPPDDKIPDFSGVEAELADVIIRILNYAGANDLRIGEALMAKLAYNEGRPYKHGKEF